MLQFQSWLVIPYIANIIILVSICYAMFLGNGIVSVFEGTVEDSLGLRLLVGSLWTAILIGSIMGLWRPEYFAPIILVQIVYKSLWLMTFVAPQLIAGNAIPFGISTTFAMIVVTYPIFFWLYLNKI